MSAMPWFETLDALECGRVLAGTSVQAVPAGEYLARQGDPPTFWYGVIDGLLKLCWNESHGRSLTFTGVCARSWFGEGTLVKNEPRRYDAIALRNTHVACMPAALFNELLQTSFAFNHFVIELLNDRCGQFIGRFLSHV